METPASLRRHIENKHKSEFEGLKKNPIKLKNVIKGQVKPNLIIQSSI